VSSRPRRDDPPADRDAGTDGGEHPADPEGASPSRELIEKGLAHIRELRALEERPDEGLRERKKRLTRQHISDVATWMFIDRGFDAVRVAEVAAEAGVSEKTVFNYFPTKESLVFDQEEETVRSIRAALTRRGPDASPTEAIVGFIEEETANFDALPEEYRPLFRAFLRLVDETPALQAAHRRLAARMVDVARRALAESAGVDPRDPEPSVAAQALMALWDVQSDSRERHIRAGTPMDGLRDAVLGDVRRAARLLDTGLWSFNQVAQGASARPQLADAAKAANEARKQVFEALRQARAAWSEVRAAHEAAHRAPDGSWWERHRAADEAGWARREELLERRRAEAARRRPR
jgi:AcrR family transcriptional regulator